MRQGVVRTANELLADFIETNKWDASFACKLIAYSAYITFGAEITLSFGGFAAEIGADAMK